MKSNKNRKVIAKVKDEGLVESRREQILKAARKVFTVKGYHKATIKDICEVSGLGPGTIYNYVNKKEDILYLIYNKMEMTIGKVLFEAFRDIKTPPDQQLKELLRRTIDLACENQDLVLLIYQETAALDKESLYNVLSRQRNVVMQWETILKRAKESGVIQSESAFLTGDIIVYLSAFIPLRGWNLRKQFDLEETKSGLLNFILKALCFTEKKKR